MRQALIARAATELEQFKGLAPELDHFHPIGVHNAEECIVLFSPEFKSLTCVALPWAGQSCCCSFLWLSFVGCWLFFGFGGCCCLSAAACSIILSKPLALGQSGVALRFTAHCLSCPCGNCNLVLLNGSFTSVANARSYSTWLAGLDAESPMNHTDVVKWYGGLRFDTKQDSPPPRPASGALSVDACWWLFHAKGGCSLIARGMGLASGTRSFCSISKVEAGTAIGVGCSRRPSTWT